MQVFEKIKSRFGDPKYDCKVFEMFPKAAFKTLAITIYVIAFAIGYLSAVMYVFVDGVTDPQVIIARTLIYGSAITILILAYGIGYLEFKKKDTPIKGHVNLIRAGALVVVVIILFSVGMVIDVPSVDRIEIIQDDPPKTYGYNTGIIENQTISATDNFYIQSGNHLIIRNSEITFSMVSDKQYSIYVAEGGTLEILNSTITSDSTKFGYGFEIYGKARITRSQITRAYGPEDLINGDTGLEIFSSDVILRDSYIGDNGANGILIADCSPILENCTFANNGDDGIELQNSDVVIRNCTIRDNEWAMIIQAGSKPVIENNQFIGNAYGISITESEPIIRNNEFRDNVEFAIQYYDNSDPTIEGNTFENNGEDVSTEISLNTVFSGACMIAFIAGVIVSVVLLIKAKQKIAREEQKKRMNDMMKK
jgi:parallel beta-helix repeat protein